MPRERVIAWLVVGLKGTATLTLLFGAWSAVSPGQSIALYQAIMRAFNWRVEPIDRPRELVTTRWFGIALIGCSLVNLFLLGHSGTQGLRQQ